MYRGTYLKNFLLLSAFGAMSTIAAWEFPTTKGRPAFIVEVAPGFLLKGPKSHRSVLYKVSDGELTNPFGKTTKVDDWSPTVGMRASATLMANNKQAMEFLYMGLFNWTPEKAVTDSSGVGVNTEPYTTNDWDSATKIQWSTKDSYNSYQLGAWFYVTPRFEDYFSFGLTGGLRFFNIVDKDLFFAFTDYLGIDEPPPIPSRMIATSDNWIRGGEFGVEVYCRLLSYFAWAIQARGGVGADFVNRKTYITDDSNATLVADIERSTKTRVSGWGEFSPYVIFHNRNFYFRLQGVGTFIARVADSSKSFLKTRHVTDIKFENEYTVAGGFLGVGYIF